MTNVYPANGRSVTGVMYILSVTYAPVFRTHCSLARKLMFHGWRVIRAEHMTLLDLSFRLNSDW